MKKMFFFIATTVCFQCFGQGNHTTFFIEANNVNVREFPNSKSKSLGKILERTTVTWLDSVENTNEIINWNGKDVKGKWYKIDAYLNQHGVQGWIFEKAFDFEKRVQHFCLENKQAIDFTKEFENVLLKTELSNRKEFESLKTRKSEIINTKKFQKDSILSIPLLNDKKYFVYENINVDNDDWLKISFCGEIKALNLYTIGLGFYEWSTFEFVKKENGLVISVGDFSELDMKDERSSIDLNFSPNNEIAVLGRGEGYQLAGICFVDVKNNKTLAIECDTPIDFRWIDSKSGIAYLISQKHWNNEPIKESFFKFTLK